MNGRLRLLDDRGSERRINYARDEVLCRPRIITAPERSRALLLRGTDARDDHACLLPRKAELVIQLLQKGQAQLLLDRFEGFPMSGIKKRCSL
jgi:hypothetical protein